MAEVVYLLCALTSALCTALLVRAYRRTGTRLLMWSALCFFGLAANNALLVVDLIILPDIDLATWRTVPAALGISVLVYGLVWDVE